MAQRAKIEVELAYRKSPNDFLSSKVELAGFEWQVSGSYSCTKHDRIGSFDIYNTEIHCRPVVDEKNTLIWNCEAFGQFVGFAAFPELQCSKLWSQSYDFRHLPSDLECIDFRSLLPETTDFRFWKSASSAFHKMEVQVNAFSQKIIDLSDRNNSMIESSDDAVQVKVDDEILWLSKTILSGSSHFFKAFFNSDFKEKRDGVYELKETDLNQFLHFVSLLYGMRVRIDADSVEYLLKMADYFQCGLITERCRDYLFHPDELSCAKNLKLADRYGFYEVIAKVVRKMDVVELKSCVGVEGLSSPTYEILCKRFDDFVQLPAAK